MADVVHVSAGRGYQAEWAPHFLVGSTGGDYGKTSASSKLSRSHIILAK
jgi:hypothetical protein